MGASGDGAGSFCVFREIRRAPRRFSQVDLLRGPPLDVTCNATTVCARSLDLPAKRRTSARLARMTKSSSQSLAATHSLTAARRLVRRV